VDEVGRFEESEDGFSEDAVEFGGFAGEEGAGGAKTVFEGVEGRDGFAFGGGGAGGFLGIYAIGFDFQFRCHDLPLSIRIR
jgi:hypothetical protein